MSVYAVSDLHGQADLWDQIKNFITPEDTLYCLGDCIDRGIGGLRIAQEMMEMPNVKYLMGNHEDLMINALRHCGTSVITKNDYDPATLDKFPYNWIVENGGNYTMSEAKAFDLDVREIAEKFAALPKEAMYESPQGHMVYLNHSGFEPWQQDLYLGGNSDILWDRSHIAESFYPWYEWRKGYEDVTIVHGHTPVGAMPTFMRYWWDKAGSPYKTATMINDFRNWEPIRYAKGHKIDIDLGCFFSKKTVLLNLDTFEEIYFYGTDYRDFNIEA